MKCISLEKITFPSKRIRVESRVCNWHVEKQVRPSSAGAISCRDGQHYSDWDDSREFRQPFGPIVNFSPISDCFLWQEYIVMLPLPCSLLNQNILPRPRENNLWLELVLFRVSSDLSLVNEGETRWWFHHCNARFPFSIRVYAARALRGLPRIARFPRWFGRNRSEKSKRLLNFRAFISIAIWMGVMGGSLQCIFLVCLTGILYLRCVNSLLWSEAAKVRQQDIAASPSLSTYLRWTGNRLSSLSQLVLVLFFHPIRPFAEYITASFR